MSYKQFEISIDGESYEAPEKDMTANELLALAGLATNEHYLVEIKGKHQEPYDGQGDKTIHLHEGSKFISVFTGATTVAFGEESTTLTGAALFASQLRDAGYELTELPDHHVQFPYTVLTGKHAGLTIEMGFVVPEDFPLTPPHGPHINKMLHPLKSGGCHPSGGIHNSAGHSKHFGHGWQHWSRPIEKWTAERRTAVRYMAFIHHLWATQ